MRRFSASAVASARNSSSYFEKHYLRPITSPLAPVRSGSGLEYPTIKSLKPVLMPRETPQPVFPMSNGIDPTPQPEMKNGDFKKRVGLIGTKLGMTTMWDEFGARKPVSVIQFRECQVVSNRFQNGRWRIQVGAFNDRKPDRAMLFVYKRYRVHPKRVMEEFEISPDACIPTGVELGAAHFVPGQYVDVQGTTRGKGFQGVMKRWGFKGGQATHGNSKNHRTGGSTGQSTTPAKVHKGKKMAGNMGNETRTAKSLRIIKIDPHENLIYVLGQVPGAAGSHVNVKDAINKVLQSECFPKDVKIPYPTFLGDRSELPREMISSPRQIRDPFLTQKKETSRPN